MSILPYSIGFLIEYFDEHVRLLGDILNNIGWAVMITGQSIVLYSRLGIIYHNRRILRMVLAMIIFDGVVFYLATTIIHYGTYSRSTSFKAGAHIIEKIQMTAYSIQEFVISGIYVREVIRYNKVVTQEHARRTIWELLVINIIIIILDIALLTLEYMDLTVLEQAFKGLAYSFKLKMEFAILGKLIGMAKAGVSLSRTAQDAPWQGASNADSRSKSDVTYTSFV